MNIITYVSSRVDVGSIGEFYFQKDNENVTEEEHHFAWFIDRIHTN